MPWHPVDWHHGYVQPQLKRKSYLASLPSSSLGSVEFNGQAHSLSLLLLSVPRQRLRHLQVALHSHTQHSPLG